MHSRMCGLLVVFLTCLSVGFGSQVRAEFILQFSSDGSVNHFDAPVGSTVSVGIYVAQNAASTALNDFGLISVGFGIKFNPNDVQLVGTNPFVFSANFPRSQDLQSTNGQLLVYGESLFNNAGANAGPVPVKGSTILLGTLSLRTMNAGIYTISVQDYEPAAPDFADFGLGGAGSSTNFDKLLFGNNTQGSFQFSIGQVSAVPEPSSIMLGLLGIAFGAVRHGRRPLKNSPKARVPSGTCAQSPVA